jgi:hypothetical protein
MILAGTARQSVPVFRDQFALREACGCRVTMVLGNFLQFIGGMPLIISVLAPSIFRLGQWY